MITGDGWPRRLFRAATRLLPFDFRREYEREMQLAFASDADAERRAGGTRDWSALLRAVAGLAPLALREHGSALVQDTRYALRSLAKSPAFTITALLSLGLGIGATTAVFRFVDAVFLHPLPVADADRVVALYTIDTRNPGFNPTSFPNYRDYRDHIRGFSGLAAYTLAPVSLSHSGEPLQALASVVTGNYFDVLGVGAVVGRTIRPEDDRTEGQAPVALLSYGLWVRQFGRDPAIVGRTVRLNGVPCAVVGVAPRAFAGTDMGLRVDLWVPAAAHARVIPGIVDVITERRLLQWSIVGRLASGTTVAAAQDEVAALGASLQRAYPEPNRERLLRLMPMREAIVDPNLRPILVIASRAVGTLVAVVLLIACVNVANLLVGRAAARQGEIAVRVALGAGRWRLARQLLTEQCLLAAGGTVVGVLLGAAAWRVLWAARPTNTLAVIEIPTDLDGRVIGFSVVVTIVTSVIFGLAPMAQVLRRPPIQDLRERGAVPAVRRWSLRNVLLVGEVALSIVALVAAGLFFHSFQNARGIPTGFATERLVLGLVDLGAQGYSQEQSRAIAQTMVTRLRTMSGVDDASLSTVMPFVAGGFGRTVFLEGDAPPPGGNGQFVTTNAVDPRYLSTTGIPLASGRNVMEFDTADSDRVALVNRTMARKFWPGRDPIGHRFHFFGERSLTVVGVVGDSKVNTVGEEPTPIAYVPLTQWPERALVATVRTARDPLGLVGAVRAEIHRVDPNLPVAGLDAMTGHVETALWNARIGAFVVGAFAAVSLALALIGLYGVLSYAIAVRHRELAVRIALGAGRGQILAMLAKETALVMLPALVLGLAGAVAVSRMTAGLLYDVPSIDVPTFVAVPAVFLGAAALAVYRPARRAARTDPTAVLRQT